MNVKEKDSEYIAGTYARFPLNIVSGKGSLVYDENGKEYIDLNSGIAVNSFGVSDGEWKDAVCAQLDLVQHTSNLYYSNPCVELAEMLCKKTGMSKVFFGNSGAEANECAIKVARKYSQDKKGEEYFTILTLVNSFHGRTLTTLAATGQDVFHHDFTPLTPGFDYVEPNNIDDLRAKVAAHKVAGIMIEVVQGEGGVVALDKDFVCEVENICKQNDIPMICDEVQIGNGRSGMLYGYMNYGVHPDIVSTAKGLAGGLPLGATMMSDKMKNVLGAGSHGSTFGGNPISCAGACSILSRIDDALLEDVKAKSEYIFSTLEGAKGIKSVSGMGLMIGVETERPAADVIAECMEQGILPIKAKNKVRLLPALNIPMDTLQKAIEILKEICAK